MKITNPLVQAAIATTLLAMLTGCTTYVVQQPEPQTTYVPAPPPPPPQPVYVQPPPPPEPVPAVVVIQRNEDFYEPLNPYGEWVVVGSYGRCWRPSHVEAGWRPYANGHWELTDDGWFWASDEPWGWATYHYGRWELAGGVGWIWVPQTQWAPAWVSWREGGGYVGWAPLPPEPRGGVSINVAIAPLAFCFVQESRMHEPVRPTTVIVNNTTIINRTTIITKTKVVNKVVINEGPRSDEVERVSGRKIEKVPINELRHKDEEPVAEKHRNLKAPDENHGQPPMQRQPEPRKGTRPDLQNADHGNPPANPIVTPPRETEKPVHPEPVTPQAPGNFHPEPAPVVLHDPLPLVGRTNREPKSHEPKVNPAPAPTPHESRPVEKPADQVSPESKSRDRQPPRPLPEVKPAPQPDNDRQNNKPDKEKNQPAPKEKNPPKEKHNGRDQGGTNTTDNADPGGRRQ